MALLSNKYKSIIANDIDPMGMELFINAVHGKYKDEDRFITRDMFFLLKDSDPYVRYCWSFGNDGRSYMYAREIEPYKEALHNMLFAKTPSERMSKWRILKQMLTSDETYATVDRDIAMERLQLLETLTRLQSLQSLQIHCGDYADINVKTDSVVYCDIPYKGTNKYQKSFDYERFYDWACRQEVPIFISEYQMPEDRFECVLEIEKQVNMCATKTGKAIEKIFVPRNRTWDF